MSRDPIYDVMKSHSKKKFDEDRKRFLEEAKDSSVNDGGWTIHTEFHWSRMLDGHRLDYWPSRKKFRYRGKVRRGDVNKLIAAKGGKGV